MGTALDDLCVAIIDDDESYCRSSSRMLRAAGIPSEIYRSAEDFLADPARGRYACLLVDVRLGRMSGLDLQEKLLAEGNVTPIIFITANDDSPARARAQRAGCAGMFLKTDDSARLLEILHGLPRADCR
jgi:FixJ family two-component response regulator